MTAAYLGVILFLTSRRSQVTRSTLAIGTGAGLLFGVVMFTVAPLGLATRHRSVAAGIAGRSAGGAGLESAVRRAGRGGRAGRMAWLRPGGATLPRNVRIGQGIAAGVLANGTAALFVSALGYGSRSSGCS